MGRRFSKSKLLDNRLLPFQKSITTLHLILYAAQAHFAGNGTTRFVYSSVKDAR